MRHRDRGWRGTERACCEHPKSTQIKPTRRIDRLADACESQLARIRQDELRLRLIGFVSLSMGERKARHQTTIELKWKALRERCFEALSFRKEDEQPKGCTL